DNGSCDGTATLVFELQNVAGGTPPAAISPLPSQFTLTITDDNVSPVSHRQWFDSDPLDQWPIVSGSGSITTLNGATDVPANQRILSGTSSWQQSDGTASLELAPIDVQDWQGTVLSARLSSPSVSATNDGVDIADSIVFYVSLNGAPFSAVPDIRVSGSPTGNARWGFATGAGIASTTAGVPAQYNPAGPGLRTTDGYSTVRILIPDGTTTVALRIQARNNSWHERWCVENISLTGTLCSQVYYSRANGSQSTPTWSTSRTGSPAPATASFTKNATAVVQATHVVTTTPAATIALRDLTVETGGTLALTGATTVDIHGTELRVDGTLQANDATARFLGSNPTSVSGSQPITLFNLEVNGPSVTQQNNALRIRGSLDVLNGAYDVNNTGNPNRNLTLVSEASGTARIGPVIAPSTFTGSIIMERYVPAGATNWRLISAATINNTLSSLEDDFLTAGYPGSHVPNFDSPVGSGILWPSIRTYNESNPGPTLNDGLIGVTGDNMVMAPGLGFMAWSGTTFNTTTAFTIDLRSRPHLGAPAITLPMTYTNNGAPSVDGWNLVGNPLPSPIDFSLISRGADVQNYYYVFDPVTGNNAIWDEALGLSIPSGSLNGNIQSCQGFWLKANGPALTTQVEEADKVLDRSGGGLFGGEQSGGSPLFRLVIGSTLNNYIDEALVHFGVGAPELGEFDIVKFPLSHPDAPRIQTRSSDGQDLMLNAFGEPSSAVTIPVAVKVALDGTYTIRMHGAEGVLGTSCLVLEDLVTGTTTVLGEGSTYSFEASAATPEQPARFLIHASAAVQHAFTDATCAGVADGTASVTGAGDGPWDITWMNAFGTPIATFPGSTGTVTLSDLPAGNYAVSVNGNGACGALVHNFTILQPAPLAASSETSPATCAEAQDGTISVSAQGGTAPYTYVWEHGVSTSDIVDAAPGSYTVLVTDANGCSLAPLTVEIPALAGPTASFLLSDTQLTIGDTLQVFNTGTYGTAYDWNFGDGSTSVESEPEHIYGQVGIYTVQLTIRDGDCSATTSLQVEVGTAQGMEDESPLSGLQVWTNGSDFIVEGTLTANGRGTLEVLDATGRTLRSARLMPNGRTTVPAQGLPSGVYFLRVQDAGTQHTYRVPLLR
ncbi:MAG TPA: PKD domain-containing protein, partial [Flavobacteriales bacterium]